MHTHPPCFHILGLRVILSASDMMMSVLWAHFSVDTNFQCFLSLCLFPPFVWADCASRLRQSDGEQLLSGKTYERTAAQQPSRKANSFNCSKKKRRGER